ncbi:hypothetical protein CEP52_001550 [Fusarium oligoseptatum]|uniref:Uncharacterized protein n=1 Tax=Fusarium oligoseptatum TaxID=2604345 RepID=A0A428UIK2_9HYPO|nr:hypothetical protein CEP52_001550 [Fusarium oligoseptatum]
MVTSTKSNRSRTPRKPASNFSKKPVKANQSILSFFKKEGKQETSLFLGAAPQSVDDEDLYTADDTARFNEDESPSKRRKLSEEPEKYKKEGDHYKN